MVKDGASAEAAYIEAKELTSASRALLTEHQNSQTAVQVDLREKSRLEVLAAAKVKEVRSDGTRVYLLCTRLLSLLLAFISA